MTNKQTPVSNKKQLLVNVVTMIEPKHFHSLLFSLYPNRKLFSFKTLSTELYFLLKSPQNFQWF